MGVFLFTFSVRFVMMPRFGILALALWVVLRFSPALAADEVMPDAGHLPNPHGATPPGGAGGSPHGPGGVPAHPPSSLAPLFTSFETGANVKALAMRGNDLWLGLANGLIRYNTQSYDDHEIFTVESTKHGDQPGLLANGIFGLDVAPDGTLWVSTYGGGITHYDGKTWKTYTPVEGLGDRWAYDVEFAPNGQMWVATWKGASVFDGEKFHTYTEADGLVDKWVYDIKIDRQGVVWMGTEGGISVFDGKTWKSYTHKDGLGADIPESERKEVMKTDSHHHEGLGKSNQGYNPNYVMSLAIDSNDVKWVGTWGAGLSRFDGKTWTTFTHKDGLGGNFIHALRFDKDGILWAATDGGVSFYKDGKWGTLTKTDGLIDDNVFSLWFEDNGTRWFGTWTGLSKLSPLLAPPLPGTHNPHG